MEYMKQKPISLVLGGTVAHEALIMQLKDRGYYTILIDYYNDPPAKKAADEHIQESTLDHAAVLAVAKERNAALVISGCVDQANATACYVAEQLCLPAPYSYSTARRVTDKRLMKDGLIRAGVPTAAHHIVGSEDDLDHLDLCYPLVVKPCDTNGSKGVRKVLCSSELRCSVRDAIDLSRTSRAVVERLNCGKEVNGYYIIRRGEARELYIKEKFLPEDSQFALQSYLTIGPAQLSAMAKGKLGHAVESIAMEFGLDNTPILIQANIDNDDISIIEFAPRVGGGLSFKEIELSTGHNIIDSVIDSYLGIPIEVDLEDKPKRLRSVVHLYGTNGILDHVEGVDQLLTEEIVEYFYMHKTPGMAMGGDLASRNRFAGTIITGETSKNILEKMHKMSEILKVISTDGENVLNRSLLHLDLDNLDVSYRTP